MDLDTIIQTFGYPAVVVGSLLEGETMLIAAGFAAHRGYLRLEFVMGLAAVASFLGDQFFFWLGRRHGPALLGRFPSLRPRVERVNTLLERYHLPIILGVRFLYGLRVAGPIAIGLSNVPRWRFFWLNLAGAVVWAVAIGAAGFLFGGALEVLIEDLHRHEGWILIGVLAAGASVWLIRRRRVR